MKLIKWFWICFFKFQYRAVDDDVCCCGASDCDGDYSHSYVNAKDYYIDLAVRNKIKGESK